MHSCPTEHLKCLASSASRALLASLFLASALTLVIKEVSDFSTISSLLAPVSTLTYINIYTIVCYFILRNKRPITRKEVLLKEKLKRLRIQLKREEKRAGLKVSPGKERRLNVIFRELERGIEPRHMNSRGRESERRFWQAWSNKGRFPGWLRAILPATLSQDLFQATDAIFYHRDKRRIRVQIKSSERAAEAHRLRHPNIPVIVIYEEDDHEAIRQNTIQAIENIFVL